MEWKKWYLDLILVPFGLLICIAYHLWLWQKVRTQPLATLIGTNALARRFWVAAMMKDIEKKNIVSVQTLRNAIMGSTLMATTSILLCAGLAAMISSTYSIKQPLNDSVYGAHGEFMEALKYVTLLVLFLFSFLCHSLSIRVLSQLTFLMSCSPECSNGLVTTEYVSELLERGVVLSTVGNRIFQCALPLVVWIFGPVLVFLCCVVLVLVLYNMDVAFVAKDKKLLGHNAHHCLSV